MKKQYRHLLPLLFTAFFVLISCSEDSSPEEEGMETEEQTETEDQNETEEGNEEVSDNAEVYFTLSVDTDYFSGQSTGWIVVHDLNGMVLDYTAIENGSSVSFEKPADEIEDVLSITFVTISTSNGNTYNTISTLTDIATGSNWKLQKSQSDPTNSRGDVIGNYTLNVNGLISPAAINLSNPGGSVLSGGASGRTVNGLTNYTFHDLTIFDKNRYLLSVYDAFGNGSYRFLNDITAGSNVTVDRTQLLPFDSTLSVNIPPDGEYFAYVSGFENDEVFNPNTAYILCMIFPFDNDKLNSSVLNLGYLDTFTSHFTRFSYENEDFYYSYEQFGEKPAAITIPQGSFEVAVEVANASLSNFQFTSTLDNRYLRKSSNWITTSGTFNTDFVQTLWSIGAGTASYPTIGALPEEILQAHPGIDIENLNYESTVFQLGNTSYQDYIDGRFINPNSEMLRNIEYIRVYN